jgi:phage baseplate assembly protein gpV
MSVIFDVSQNDPGVPITVNSSRVVGSSTISVTGWPSTWTSFPMVLTATRAGNLRAYFRVTGQASGILSGATPIEGPDASLAVGDLLFCRPTAGQDMFIKSVISAFDESGGGGSIDESNIVHRTGNETINGIKTFTNAIAAPNGSGANVVGSDLVLAGGRSTGDASGGSVHIQISPASTTPGTTPNDLADALMIDSHGAIFSYNVVAPSYNVTGTGSQYTINKRGDNTQAGAIYSGGTSGHIQVYHNGFGGDIFTLTSTTAILGVKLNTIGRDGPVTTVADGTTITFDLAVSDLKLTTPQGDRTLAVANATLGQKFTIIIIGDGTPHNLTWWSGIVWMTSDGLKPTPNSAAGKRTVIQFVVESVGVYLGFLVAIQS